VTGAMCAVIPVRDGVLPLGGDEAVAEAGGRALLIGSGTAAAAATLAAADVTTAEVGPYAPGAWAAALAPHLAAVDVVVLPASPDGRDLAPRLARVLGRPLLAGAIEITPTGASLARRGGLVTEEHAIRGPVVATLEPGVRGAGPAAGPGPVRTLALTLTPHADAEVLEVLPPDPATMDLADATRIIAGGAGLHGPEPFGVLEEVAGALGVSWGASRVAADAGWVPAWRFIGTTGVTVHPELYVGLGISGAVQHVAGIGHPTHLIAVNTDASAPLMAMADLAIVTDAVALLNELARRCGDIDADGAGATVGSGARPDGTGRG
jgi:electron transfer flavoprotein alpha subunit